MVIIFREIRNFFFPQWLVPLQRAYWQAMAMSNWSAILTLKSRLHKVFPVTWQAAVRMDYFRYPKIQNEIKQKNVLFTAEPQDNLSSFISPTLAYLRTQKFHSEAIISCGFDTELQYTRLFHQFFYWMLIGRSEKKLQCRKDEEIENMWWSTSELLVRAYRINLREKLFYGLCRPTKISEHDWLISHCRQSRQCKN